MSDKEIISPYNITATSSRQLMRIKKISVRDYQLSNTTFSDLTSQELCSRQ